MGIEQAYSLAADLDGYLDAGAIATGMVSVVRQWLW